jgi:hypothetical protein
VNDVTLIQSNVTKPPYTALNFVKSNFLKHVTKNNENTNRPLGQPANKQDSTLAGYPSYPAEDDIYSKYKQEKEINPEDVSKTKDPYERKDAITDMGKNSPVDDFGRDLDIPGSELDDNQEDIGSEDEENNYYSLGGDAHNGLEEDQGI